MTILDIIITREDRGILIVVGFLVLFALVDLWERRRQR